MKKYIVNLLQQFADNLVLQLETCPDNKVQMFYELGIQLNTWSTFYGIYLE